MASLWNHYHFRIISDIEIVLLEMVTEMTAATEFGDTMKNPFLLSKKESWKLFKQMKCSNISSTSIATSNRKALRTNFSLSSIKQFHLSSIFTHRSYEKTKRRKTTGEKRQKTEEKIHCKLPPSHRYRYSHRRRRIIPPSRAFDAPPPPQTQRHRGHGLNTHTYTSIWDRRI